MREQMMIDDLETAFRRFKEALGQERKIRLSEIERLCSEIRSFDQSSGYLSGKCSSLYSECKEMSRLRQPAHYNEQTHMSRALGDISMIKQLLTELIDK